MIDPFTTLGIEPALDPDMDAVERQYLERSRATHPDHQATTDAVDLDALQRSADLNTAWGILRDEWKRTRAFLEQKEPGIMDRTAKLPPDLLMAVMEQQEEAALAAAEERPELRRSATAALDTCRQEIRDRCAAGDFAGAAVQLHLSTYHRRTLDALQSDTEEASER